MNTVDSIIFTPNPSDSQVQEITNKLKVYFNNKNFDVGFTPVLLNQIAILFGNHKIKVRKYKNYCRSCIITDAQVNEMASFIYALWRVNKLNTSDDNAMPASFEELAESVKKQFCEWVYIIPVAFKQLGYELYRPAEDTFINEPLAEQLARSIHAQFCKHMVDKTSTNVYRGMYLISENKQTFTKEFDKLSSDIKAANIDNAFHIPSKLLSIGYKIQPVDTGVMPQLLKLCDNEIETMAMIEHDRWSWERRLSGWTYNKIRNNNLKQHNCLVPYNELPPHEQEKDRIMVRFIPALLVDIGYVAVKVSPELSEDIPYINQQAGFVFEVETQIKNLQSIITQQNDEIQNRFDNVFNKINSVNELKNEIKLFHKYLSKQYLHTTLKRLDTTNNLLKHIKGTFRSGQYIQKTFMPQPYELKEHFPDSFILFKPKDIVSGDFYFISKINNSVIFTAADCTGHGISGSILSGICYNFLHEAVNNNKIENPVDILSYVMPKIRDLLKHSSSLVAGSSEMELALCCINTKTSTLKVASYGRPVYVFINNELTQLGKGAKTVNTKLINGYHAQEVRLQKGNTVYSFSDGYADQLGGVDSRKYMTKKFKHLLTEIQDSSMSEQCEKLNNEIEDWKKCEGKYHTANTVVIEDQTDDITVIGVRL